MKIIILGSTGLLGTYITNYLTCGAKLAGERNYRVVALNRKHFDASTRKLPDSIIQTITPSDVVINCTGVLKPNIKKVGEAKTIMINSHFPQVVADVCSARGARYIHICSDCVFSGDKGSYLETDACDASDLYGRTKSIVPSYGTIIRTSFIGEDDRPAANGLMSFIKSHDTGCRVHGYDNCMWNGITALQLAVIIEHIILTKGYWAGVRHIFTMDHVSKYDVCRLVNDVYNLQLSVCRYRADNISGSPIPPSGSLDRTLSTIYQPIYVPSLEQQLIELKNSRYHVSSQ